LKYYYDCLSIPCECVIDNEKIVLKKPLPEVDLFKIQSLDSRDRLYIQFSKLKSDTDILDFISRYGFLGIGMDYIKIKTAYLTSHTHSLGNYFESLPEIRNEISLMQYILNVKAGLDSLSKYTLLGDPFVCMPDNIRSNCSYESCSGIACQQFKDSCEFLIKHTGVSTVDSNHVYWCHGDGEIARLCIEVAINDKIRDYTPSLVYRDSQEILKDCTRCSKKHDCLHFQNCIRIKCPDLIDNVCRGSKCGFQNDTRSQHCGHIEIIPSGYFETRSTSRPITALYLMLFDDILLGKSTKRCAACSQYFVPERENQDCCSNRCSTLKRVRKFRKNSNKDNLLMATPLSS